MMAVPEKTNEAADHLLYSKAPNYIIRINVYYCISSTAIVSVSGGNIINNRMVQV